MPENQSTTPPALSIFDQHHPPEPELIEDCVHCGFCLPTCPTYALWGEEMDSPRGRIYLMKLGTEGKANLTANYVEHFDRCLGCMACVTACPSGVQYEKLIETTRAQIERHYSRSFADRLFRKLIFSVFPYPRRLRIMALPLWIYQRSGIQRLLRSSGAMNLMPTQLRAMESLLPELSSDSLSATMPPVIPPRGTRRMRVGLLLGCVQQVFFAQVNAATARVLTAEGCEVVIPQEQGCCGALMVHAGVEEQALAFARRTIDAFEQAGVEAVVINAAGCGSSMKEYGYLLRDDPKYAERAKAFSAKCKDISEILCELPSQAKRNPVNLRIAYHDACHLQHAQRVRKQPRDLLKAIPGLEVLEIPESALCCGSAGIYNVIEPGPAEQLGDRKVRNVLSTGAQMVISSNPGCLLQLRNGLERARRPLPTRHIVELLDASIRGISLA
jgi:glycolate dehydrogenase iron-sulfur subunit